MNKNRYMAIDLGIFAMIVCVLEYVNSLALKLFPQEIFTLSIVLPVTLIVMMRWGAWGLLHAALGGVAYCTVYREYGAADMSVTHSYIIYAAGALGIALAMIWFIRPGKDKLRKSWPWITVYTVTGYAGMCLGRTLVAAALGYGNLLSILIRYLTVESLSGVIGLVVILVAAKQDGVFEDQNSYLKRLAEEKIKLAQDKEDKQQCSNQ